MKMNVPNALTILRICLVPVFVLFMLTGIGGSYGDIIAGVIFIIASLTDTLDGHIARKYDQITVFGKFMDPLADKLLVCSALICLVELERIPAWIVIIIIGRDFIISGFRLVAAGKGVVIAADMSGKIKTTLQMIMILFIIADLSFLAIPTLVLEIAVLILTVVSLIICIVKNRKVLSETK